GGAQLGERLGIMPGTVRRQARRLAYEPDARCPPPGRLRMLPGGLRVVVDEPPDHHEMPRDLLGREGAQARQGAPDVAVELGTGHVVRDRGARWRPLPPAAPTTGRTPG